MKTPPWWVIVVVAYFLYNTCIVSALIKDAIKTSWRESDCTIWKIVAAFTIALPLHVLTLLAYIIGTFKVWILPTFFPERYRVGGGRVEYDNPPNGI